MTVGVTVPMRLRVDPAALRDRPDDLADALLTAATRALAGSVTHVLEPRGAYVGVQLDSPTIRWSGSELERVDADARERIEALCRAAVAEAVAQSGVLEQGAANAELRTPLSDDAVERLARDRFLPFLGVYTLPSYQHGGDPTTIPVDSQTIVFGDDQSNWMVDWKPISTREDFFVAFDEEMTVRGITRPTAGHLGSIFRGPGGSIQIAVFAFPSGDELFEDPINGLTAPHVNAAGTAIEQRPVQLPGDGVYRLRYHASGAAAGRRALAETYYRAGLLRQFRDEGHFPPTMSSADIDQQVGERANQAIDAIVSSFPEDTSCFLLFEVNGTGHLLWTRRQIPTDFRADLIPLVEMRPGTPAGGTGAGTQGHGAKTGEGTGTGTGTGSGTGTGEPGGFIDLGDESPPSEGGSYFPYIEGARHQTLTCEPFNGEPGIQDLGHAGELMRTKMGQLAFRLQIMPCEFVGKFLLNAATALESRARQVGMWETTEHAATTAVPAPAPGTLGSLRFHPRASAQIQLLRHLAATVPFVTELENMLTNTIRAHPDQIEGWQHNNSSSWILHFYEELHPAMDEAVAALFTMTCRVLFAQLLNGSHEAIETRLNEPGFTPFADQFERVVVPELAEIEELQRLRSRLEGAPAAHANAMMVAAYAHVPVQGAVATTATLRPANWREATHAVTAALGGAPRQRLTEGAPVANAYETFHDDDGWKIRDRHGRVWTTETIEAGIQLRRGVVETMEPLVKQLTDIPEVMERFRAPDGGVRAELQRVLEEMKAKNEDIAWRARLDPDYGFKASSIAENVEHATVAYTNYSLQGIHREAHNQIGEFFRGDGFYARGIEFLFASTLGKQALLGFGEFVGIVILAVLCPPAAIGAGIALAEHHYEEALERERIYGALIDPEQVLSYAEVEAGLFASEVGLALSFLPVGVEFAGEVRAAFGVAAREAAEVGEAAASAAARQLMRTVERGIVEAFVVELGKAYAISKVFEISLTPIMRALEREWGTTGPIGGLDRALATVLERARARRAVAQGTAPH